MSLVPETAAMRELDDKAVRPRQLRKEKGPQQEVAPPEQSLSLGSKTEEDAARFSPDPLRRTDRYRLAQPFNIPL